MHKVQSLEEAIRAEAERLGFSACGFARADAADASGLEIKRWIEAGHHGTMGWMEERAHHRVSPLALWPDAKSAIALGMSCGWLRGAATITRRSRKALKALARFIVDAVPSELKVFVDTAPVMEKPLAQAAGIGWQGKHTNLVSREHGSWMFLGGHPDEPGATPDAPAEQGVHCGSCALSRRLPDGCLPGTAPDRCAALHFVPDDRA